MSRLATLAVTTFFLGITSLVGAADVPPKASSSTGVAKPGYADVVNEAFSTAASSSWKINHGKWTIADGGWQGVELAEDKHAAVARYTLGFTDAVFDVDFRLDGAKIVQLSINDANNHLCRVQILPDRMRVMKDDHDKAGPDKAVVLEDKAVKLEPGRWYHARVEFVGDAMTTELSGDSFDRVVAGGRHEMLTTPKANFAFVVNGAGASFKNLRVATPEKK